jgi:uncharacterized protein (DUF433 family)
MVRTSALSSCLKRTQRVKLARKARQLGRSPSEVGAMFIDEGLRRDEFAFIDFRESAVGRQAYIQGSSLAVWEIAWIAEHYQNSVEKTAKHLELPKLKVQAALSYAECYPDEIKQALDDFRQVSSLDSLKRALPQVEVFPPDRK